MQEPGNPVKRYCKFTAKRLCTESALFRRRVNRLTMRFHSQRFQMLDVWRRQMESTRRKKKKGKEKNRGGFLRPSRRTIRNNINVVALLELVAHAELHAAIKRQGSGEEPEAAGYIRFNIRRLHIEADAVECVVNIPTELQLLALGDVKNLVQAQVGIEVSRSAKGIAASHLAGIVLAIGIDRGGVIREHVGLAVCDRHSC